jgi:hypothetical protein
MKLEQLNNGEYRKKGGFSSIRAEKCSPRNKHVFQAHVLGEGDFGYVIELDVHLL